MTCENKKGPKFVILFGEKGSGKSAFVNCLAGLTSDNLAKEGDFNNTFKTEPGFYELEREGFGKLIFIDTEGMNNTIPIDFNYGILKIFHTLFSLDADYSVDAILFFESASNSKSNCLKYLDSFCQIFKADKERVKESSIYVHSKYADVFERNRRDHLKKMEQIKKEHNLSQINWDSKYPLDNQFGDLIYLLNQTKRFKLRLDYFEDEINKIAIELREKNKNIPQKTAISKSKAYKIQRMHKIDGSENASWLKIPKPLLKLYSCRTMLDLTLPEKLPNQTYDEIQVNNFKYKILEKSNVVDKDGCPLLIRLSANRKSFVCLFYVDSAQFEHGRVLFEVTYNLEFAINTTEKIENIQYGNSIERYWKEATDRFLSSLKPSQDPTDSIYKRKLKVILNAAGSNCVPRKKDPNDEND